MSKRILLVEDNPINQELAYDLLTAVGFEVLCAVDADEGIRIAHESTPDLILMDLVLPGKDGLAATQELKSDERTRAIPVIAVTAHAMAEDRERALAVGCDGYLTKPIQTREFTQLITRFRPDGGAPLERPQMLEAEPIEESTPLFDEPEIPPVIWNLTPSSRIRPSHKDSLMTLAPRESPAVARERTRVLISLRDSAAVKQAEVALRQLNCEPILVHDGMEAIQRARTEDFHLIILAATPGMQGEEAIRFLRARPETAELPILAVLEASDGENASRAFAAGAHDMIALPLNPTEFTMRASRLMEWQESREEARQARREAELQSRLRATSLRALQEEGERIETGGEGRAQVRQDVADAIALAAEQIRGSRNVQSALRHLDAVSEYSEFLARKTSMPVEEVEILKVASRLHDVGYLYLPDRLFEKSGKMNSTEMREWQQHTNMGNWFLSRLSSAVLSAGREIAASHHEWWNGGGFPKQQSNKKIPLSARIVSLAHAIDDLTHFGVICDEAPYPLESTELLGFDDIMSVLEAERGKRFDPALIDLVKRHKAEFRTLLNTRLPQFPSDHAPDAPTMTGPRAVA